MTANPILLQKKYSRVIECFAKQQGLSLDVALDFFYHSQVYQLIRDGVSDMHCMSDAYLAEELKQEYEEFMTITPCKECKGQRLKKSSLAVTVSDKNIYEITSMSIRDLHKFLEDMELTDRQKFIGGEILKEIKARIKFLMDVGLDYLTLSRGTAS